MLLLCEGCWLFRLVCGDIDSPVMMMNYVLVLFFGIRMILLNPNF